MTPTTATIAPSTITMKPSLLSVPAAVTLLLKTGIVMLAHGRNAPTTPPRPPSATSHAMRFFFRGGAAGSAGAGWAGGGVTGLVVALGVDAAEADPESPLHVSADGYRAAGRALGALGLPTVVVQEGGYDLATIGMLVRETLAGIEEGLA